MATRALVFAPKTARRGEVLEIRATVQHPMETGHRSDSAGGVLPRDILRRMECRWDGVNRESEVVVPTMTLAEGLARVMARPERGGVFEHAWALAKETL